MVAGLLISSVGLHRFIPYLSVPKAMEGFGPRQFLDQTIDALRLPSLRAILIAGVVSATGQGVRMVLWGYLHGYYWEVPTSEMSHLMILSALGALPGLYWLPRLAAGREKKSLAIGLTLVVTFSDLLPVLLRLIGVVPENGSDGLYWALMLQNFVSGIFTVMLMGVLGSMVADLVEQVQLDTAHRSEGIILSAVTFSRKAAWALGTVLAGVALDLAAFPTGAAVGDIPEPILVRFGLIYGPVLLTCGLVAAYFLSRYKIDRADHKRSVETLGLGN